nr:reverse transcriptase domain-containing protein [Tanacetum cinerariifolium]
MSTRSSARNLFPPLDNPELTIQRRSRADPTLLNDFEMAIEGNGDPPVPDLQTMEELNEITNFRQRPDESLFEARERYKLSIDRCPNHNMLPVTQVDTFYNGLTLRHRDTINVAAAKDANLKNMQTNMTSLTNSNLELQNMFGQFMKINTASSSGSGTLPGNTIINPKEELKGITTRSGTAYCNTVTNPKEDSKGITTRSGTAYQGPTTPTTSSSLPQVVERKTEVTKDTVPPTNNGSTKDVQPPVVQIETSIPNYEPVIAPVAEPVVALVSAPKPNPKPSIPYPSRLHDQKLRDKANDQKEKIFQIFQDLNFNISFADALILMPKFGPTIKRLLTNKDKVYELARTPLNEHCSAVLLKKLPGKLGDPGKFLIPCDLPGMDECLALADLGASINLMPLSVWNKISLPELTPTLMTLELADRSFLKTGRALIDVYAGEFTLRVNNEAVTFNLDQTSIYSTNFNDITANQIDVIDMACKEYSQEVLDFSDVIASGNPTPYYDPIVSTSSPTLTPFRDSDFLLEEVDAFLDLEDDPTSQEVDHSYYDTKGDILLLEAFLNDDPLLPPPNQGMYLPQDLPPHLEYAFLEGDDKSPIIIAKDLSVEEKAALIKVLKSHKQAIAWKLSDIKGINPEFCTHKILIEDDFEPAVQHQRMVNPKIHDVIKKEGGVYALTTIKKRPHSRVLMERLPTVACLFGYEKSYFMVKECIVLGHKFSKNGIEVDRTKVDVITKLPHPTTVKGIRSFVGHAGFDRRFIQDFSKIARPMTRLLEKDTSFFFSNECVEAFQTLKKKLTEAPILVAPDWDLHFELMCDAIDFAIGAVLGQ